MVLIGLVILLLQSTNSISGQMQCRDESGKAVDWYIAYKFPRVPNGKSPLDSGFRYAYITSDDEKSGWTLSEEAITVGKKSIFGQTLQSLYATKLETKISYINYNDEVPGGKTSFTGGHSKGVVATDNTHGFWLIHSVPNFPSNETTHEYEYPATGGRYGQNALCISFEISELDNIAEQLLYIQPNIYESKISDALMKSSAKVNALINKKWSTGQSNKVSIKSIAGVSFTSFSKSPDDHVDLYADIVAPDLKSDLYVETWRNGKYLPSDCKKTKTVENVNEISIKFSKSKESGEFSYKEDHSKWAVSKEPSLPYVCFGDINRMGSQFVRGGGTTCLKSAAVWKHISDWISAVEKC